MAACFDAMGFRSRDGGSDALRAFADLLLEASAPTRRSAHAGHRRRAPPSSACCDLTRDNPIVAIPADFVLLGRVFAALGGLLMRYRPRVNLFQIIFPSLLRATQAAAS